ncbi:MAG: sigma-54-dependent Fis family transcriptional regulator [Burkholderiales bacterium]|nr:sigma-54-dependent Fis family transcriptional regulator [Burkholderiales bacterium]
MRKLAEVREHVGLVTDVINRRHTQDAAATRFSHLLDSWERSMSAWQIDPGQVSRPRVVTSTELKDHLGSVDSLLRVGNHAVTRLHAQVRDANYCVLLTDAEGVTVLFEGVPTLAREFRQEGFRVGTTWSEREEGTCGVGTAIVDKAPMLVHRGEHFRAHNIAFTCSAAPVFAPNGELLAILDASALSSPEDKRSQTLVFQLVVNHAAAMENAFFVESFKGHWILQVSPSLQFVDLKPAYLFALDDAGRIVAANRPARDRFYRHGLPADTRLEHLFDCSALDVMRGSFERPGCPVPLRRPIAGEVLFGVLRAPARGNDASAYARRGNERPATPVAPAIARAFRDLAVADPAVARDVQRAVRIVNAKVPLLLTGETGTGKEAFAKALHEASDRCGGPFVAVNCAAIPDTLIESELFGYRAGAFTGANAKGSRGRIQQAHGGTLLLDEIGDMPLALQSRLLRVLAEGEVAPLGGAAPEQVDVHVICATHCDLKTLIADGRFREDLYFRLAGAMIQLPPLRDRTDRDELIALVLEQEARARGRAVSLGLDVAAALAGYRWPGNIRELRNVLRLACALCDGPVLTLDCLPPEILAPVRPTVPSAMPAELRPSDRDHVVLVLKRNTWNVAASARELGVSRPTLYRWIHRHRIVSPNKAG